MSHMCGGKADATEQMLWEDEIRAKGVLCLLPLSAVWAHRMHGVPAPSAKQWLSGAQGAGSAWVLRAASWRPPSSQLSSPWPPFFQFSCQHSLCFLSYPLLFQDQAHSYFNGDYLCHV